MGILIFFSVFYLVISSEGIGNIIFQELMSKPEDTARAGIKENSKSVPDTGLVANDNYTVEIDELVQSKITNDPLSKLQWNLRSVYGDDYAENYNEINNNAPREVIVAVIDRSVNVKHDDLRNRVTEGWNFRTGKKDSTESYDNKTPNSSVYHGGCVASIIGAETGNGIGMAGIFSKAVIMPISTNLDNMANAIKYAVENGAEVIHIGGGVDELIIPTYFTENENKFRTGLYSEKNIDILKSIRSALDYAYEEDIVVVTGAGNTGTWENYMMPASTRTISVGPHNIHDCISSHASYSFTYEIFAPGGSRKKINNFREIYSHLNLSDKIIFSSHNANFDDVLCAVGKDKYSYLTLGSAAIPHVSAAVALIKSYKPESSVEEVRNILQMSSEGLDSCRNLLEGLGGRLSIYNIYKLLVNEDD
ncbi:S8 family peptidase [Limisalsivibrio acetivorans]|uniref:S8 family peptidase n=1 Tax=Limisalsivibrio acetivorans TaxID=1304888 RepID=UPI00138AE5EB|nr:S8 family serine peptidase [Limisalsivibrio acetivorans]